MTGRGVNQIRRSESGRLLRSDSEGEGGDCGLTVAWRWRRASPVSCLLSPVSCLLSPVSCLLSPHFKLAGAVPTPTLARSFQFWQCAGTGQINLNQVVRLREGRNTINE